MADPNDYVDLVQSLLPDMSGGPAHIATQARLQALGKQKKMGMVGMLTGDPVLAPFGKELVGDSRHEIDTLAHYGPDQQMLKLLNMRGMLLPKLYGTDVKAETAAGHDETSKGIAEGRNTTAVDVGKGHDDARRYAADQQLAAAGLRSTAAGNKEKDLSPTELKELTGFDSALGRLDTVEQLFKTAPGTYPGAGTLHQLAQVVNQADPNFAALQTAAGGHLLKAIKADIGGRVTNFEIKYGKHLFPNEDDPLNVAQAKIIVLRQMMNEDRGIHLQNFQKAGRKVGGFLSKVKDAVAPPAPAAAPAPGPGAAPQQKPIRKFNMKTGQFDD